MKVDPVIMWVVCICMTMLFATAGWHKLKNQSQFRVIVGEYQILPESLVSLVAILIPLIELDLAVAWLFQLMPAFTASCSIALLTIYCLAIGANLVRGRRHINCGCGFGGSSDAEVPLSSGLILRNLVLIMVLVVCFIPQTGRALVWIDYMAVLFATIMGLLLYCSSSQLLHNSSFMASWRRSW